MAINKPIAIAAIVVVVAIVLGMLATAPPQSGKDTVPAVPAIPGTVTDTVNRTVPVPAVTTVQNITNQSAVVVPVSPVNNAQPIQADNVTANVTVPVAPVPVVNATSGGCTDTSVPSDTTGHATINLTIEGLPVNFSYMLSVSQMNGTVLANASGVSNDPCGPALSLNVSFLMTASGNDTVTVSVQTFPPPGSLPGRIPPEVQTLTIVDGETTVAWF